MFTEAQLQESTKEIQNLMITAGKADGDLGALLREPLPTVVPTEEPALAQYKAKKTLQEMGRAVTFALFSQYNPKIEGAKLPFAFHVDHFNELALFYAMVMATPEANRLKALRAFSASCTGSFIETLPQTTESSIKVRELQTAFLAMVQDPTDKTKINQNFMESLQHISTTVNYGNLFPMNTLVAVDQPKISYDKASLSQRLQQLSLAELQSFYQRLQANQQLIAPALDARARLQSKNIFKVIGRLAQRASQGGKPSKKTLQKRMSLAKARPIDGLNKEALIPLILKTVENEVLALNGLRKGAEKFSYLTTTPIVDPLAFDAPTVAATTAVAPAEPTTAPTGKPVSKNTAGTFAATAKAKGPVLAETVDFNKLLRDAVLVAKSILVNVSKQDEFCNNTTDYELLKQVIDLPAESMLKQITDMTQEQKLSLVGLIPHTPGIKNLEPVFIQALDPNNALQKLLAYVDSLQRSTPAP